MANRKWKLHELLVYLGEKGLRGLESTLVWEYTAPFPPLPSQPHLIVCWHSRLLMLPFLYPLERKAAALVSPSTDGDLLSQLLARLGRETIRGSSRRGGVSSLRQILVYLERGYDIAVTLDGPQGPPYKAKPATIHLAIRYQIPIFPISFYARNRITLHTWDRMIIPLPYSLALCSYGTPFRLPPDLPTSSGVKRVEEALNQLIAQERAWETSYKAGAT